MSLRNSSRISDLDLHVNAILLAELFRAAITDMKVRRLKLPLLQSHRASVDDLDLAEAV